jgi:CO dehydrogenase/acetyl-CoA synthase beta subunit
MNRKIIENIRKFVDKQSENGKIVTNYIAKSNPTNYFNKLGIHVGLNENKEIILQEETHLELGGMNKSSFSIVFPIKELNSIHDGVITIIGPKIHQITEYSTDFGLFILIGTKKVSKNEISKLRSLNFLSNGIEGFSIRTIPRRFWCRISNEVFKKNFSIEFLANAIIYLYKQEFKQSVEKVELIILNSYRDSIEEFINLSSDITNKFREELNAKIDEWRKRIDCDYDWGCEICPYQEDCYEIKQVLVERERIG